MTPRNEYLAKAFVWTCAIMTLAMIIAFLPFVQGVMWWVWGSGNPPL